MIRNEDITELIELLNFKWKNNSGHQQIANNIDSHSQKSSNQIHSNCIINLTIYVFLNAQKLAISIHSDIIEW